MTLILIILFNWCILKAFKDAIIFAKGGTSCFTIWHIIDWLFFWGVSLYAIYELGLYKNFWLMVLLVAGSFMFNFFYRLFRCLNVHKLDNRIRIKWLEKILERGGII